MNPSDIARDYFRKAVSRFKALQVLYEERSYADVVRESQEIIELILEGALRYIGIEPLKRHDIGSTILRYADLLPSEWQENAEVIAEVSRQLYAERGPAFYGDEDAGIPSSEIYDESDAKQALSWVQHILEMFARLLKET